MKAFLLAAGIGSRLRPLTDKIPKCLVPVAGKPLLYYWFKLFERYGINEVFINLHYLPEKVRSFIESFETYVKVTLFFEEELLGSAGTVFYNRKWIGRDNKFIVAYADNLTNMDIADLVRFHDEKKGVMTIGLFKAENPCECGIVEMDSLSAITAFYEKNDNPPGNLANAGIYVVERSVFDLFELRKPLDFGFDILPQLTGSIYGYKINQYYIDVGSPKNYSKARSDWEKVLIESDYLR